MIHVFLDVLGSLFALAKGKKWGKIGNVFRTKKKFSFVHSFPAAPRKRDSFEDNPSSEIVLGKSFERDGAWKSSRDRRAPPRFEFQDGPLENQNFLNCICSH